MIEPVAPPFEILSSYTKINFTENRLEVHRYESINGGVPKHTVEYCLYNNRGQIEQSQQSSVDIKV